MPQEVMLKVTGRVTVRVLGEPLEKLMDRLAEAVANVLQTNKGAGTSVTDVACDAAVVPEAFAEGVWAEDFDHPRVDWQTEVGLGDTNLGYWDWVAAKREAQTEGEEHGDAEASS